MIEQRKTVSVVFADLVDSTSLAERLDAEVLAGVLQRYFETLRAVLEKHGGTVEKFIGDAVVGVFGIPTLHEDDALRAVRAALEMQPALETADAELRIRVGVNTGEIVVTGDNRMGHAISMAARLEQSAAAGEVLIGRQTFVLVANAVQAQELPPLTVKGSSEALAAWRVTGMGDVPQRGARSAGPYVGREHELAHLKQAFELAVATPACVTVTVAAPPGLGKSRLINEAVGRIDGRAQALVGRCLPYGEQITYAPLIEMLSSLQASRGSHAVEDVMAGRPESEQVVGRLLATLEGAASGSPDETAWAFRRLFEALAAAQPLVLFVDDIHWADPVLLDLLEYVGTFSVGSPILLLCAARPDLFETRPAWAAPRENVQQVRLAPLTAEETDGLLAGLGQQLDEQARRRIVETAGGVPLFVEQMAAFGAEASDHAQIPPTIRALLAARVDRLAPEERALLESAAIQGATFDRDTLAELLPAPQRATLGSGLMGLIRREFIRPEPGQAGQPGRGGHDAFAFNHALIRDAVYEQLPRRSRAELHERYAAILAGHDEPNDIVAHHLEQALRERAALGESGEQVAQLARRAGAALAAAGREATARIEAGRAIDLLTRANDVLKDQPDLRVRVLPDLIDAMVTAGNQESADRAHGQAVALARQLGDETSELRAEMSWGISEARRDATGWQTRLMPVIDRAVTHFERIGDDLALAEALVLKGLALAPTDQVAAVEALRQAHAHAQQTDDERIAVAAWDELGGAMLFGPTPYAETLDFTRAEVEWARAHGIAFSVADGQLGESYSLAALGKFDEARALLNELIDLFAQLPGRVSQYGECYTLAGRIERDRGNPAAATELYRKAMELFERGGYRRWWRSAAPGVAHALLDLNRLDEAKAVLDEIANHGGGMDEAAGAFRLEAEARYASLTGDPAGGVRLGQRAVDAVADSGAPFYEGRARETLAGLLLAAGDPDGAQREWQQARALYAAKGYLPGVQRIDELLARS